MVNSATGGDRPRMRADARRNRDQLVAVAREIFVERGADVPMEEIARRAGVGVGTLYRHFPDRSALIGAAAAEGMRRVLDLVRPEGDRASDPGEALCEFLHRCVEHRFGQFQGALHERIVEAIESSRELREARDAVFDVVDRMVQEAQRAGAVRADVAAGDVLLMLGLVLRPLAGVSAETADLVRRRILTIAIEGLRSPAHRPLAGEPIRVADLDSALRQRKPSA